MLNKTILQGRLTADIELKQTQLGVSNTAFTVAWSEKYKEVETKLFLRCKAWRQTAEFLSKYFVKGSELIVEGQLSTEEWEKDGTKHSHTILTVDKVHFCSKKSDNISTNKDISTKFVEVELSEIEDLPF